MAFDNEMGLKLVENDVQRWLDNSKLGHIYSACIAEGWDEIDTFLEIDIKDKELDGLIPDICNHVKLKNSEKIKLKRAIIKLQNEKKHLASKSQIITKTPARKSSIEIATASTDIIDINKCIANECETKEDEKENMNNNNHKIDNEALSCSFECDTCEKTLSECQLFYCTLCNQAVESLDKRKYYCKKHILILHQDRKSCANHKNIVINEIKNMDNNNNNQLKSGNNSNAIQKLTFDVAMIESSKKQSLDTVTKSIVKYLNNCVTKKIDIATNVAHGASTIPAMTVVLGAECVVNLEHCPLSYKGLAMATTLSVGVSMVTALCGLGFYFHQYHRGDFNKKELARKCVLSMSKWFTGLCSSSFGAGLVGGASIAAFTTFAPLSGAVGIVSIIASIFGSYCGIKISDAICNKLINYLFDKLFGISEDKEKETQIAQAFAYFQFNKNELKTFKQNSEKNKKLLRSKYRNYAKLYHPDRNGGSPEKFAELQMNYEILRAVLNCKLNDKQMTEVVSDSLQALMM